MSRQVIHVKMAKRGKDGKMETVLQAFEIVNGTRRPISTPPKNAVPDKQENKHDYVRKDSFRRRPR